MKDLYNNRCLFFSICLVLASPFFLLWLLRFELIRLLLRAFGSCRRRYHVECPADAVWAAPVGVRGRRDFGVRVRDCVSRSRVDKKICKAEENARRRFLSNSHRRVSSILRLRRGGAKGSYGALFAL